MDIPNIAEKEIVAVQYYNVIFYMIFRKDVDMLRRRSLSDWLKNGRNIRMKDIYGWCISQNVPVLMKYMYRKDFSLSANLWNLISYWRFKLEKRKKYSSQIAAQRQMRMRSRWRRPIREDRTLSCSQELSTEEHC